MLEPARVGAGPGELEAPKENSDGDADADMRDDPSYDDVL